MKIEAQRLAPNQINPPQNRAQNIAQNGDQFPAQKYSKNRAPNQINQSSSKQLKMELAEDLDHL